MGRAWDKTVELHLPPYPYVYAFARWLWKRYGYRAVVKPRLEPPYTIYIVLTRRRDRLQELVTLVRFSSEDLPESFQELSRVFWHYWNLYRREYGWHHSY